MDCFRKWGLTKLLIIFLYELGKGTGMWFGHPKMYSNFHISEADFYDESNSKGIYFLRRFVVSELGPIRYFGTIRDPTTCAEFGARNV